MDSCQIHGSRYWSRNIGRTLITQLLPTFANQASLGILWPPTKAWHRSQWSGIRSISNQENVLPNAHRPIWWNKFLKHNSLFPGMSSWSQPTAIIMWNMDSHSVSKCGLQSPIPHVYLSSIVNSSEHFANASFHLYFNRIPNVVQKWQGIC